MTIPEDHKLTVDLPAGFPAGPAEVIVLAGPAEGPRTVRAGGALSASQPHTEGDPIAEALRELREERAAALQALAEDVGRGEQ